MSALINRHDDSNQNEGEKQQSIDNRLAPSLMSWKVPLHLSLPSCSLFLRPKLIPKYSVGPRIDCLSQTENCSSLQLHEKPIVFILFLSGVMQSHVFRVITIRHLKKVRSKEREKHKEDCVIREHRKHLFAQHFASLRNLSAVCARDVYQLKSVRSDFHIWIRLPTKGIRKKIHLVQRETGKSMDWRVIMLNIPPRSEPE